MKTSYKNISLTISLRLLQRVQATVNGNAINASIKGTYL